MPALLTGGKFQKASIKNHINPTNQIPKMKLGFGCLYIEFSKLEFMCDLIFSIWSLFFRSVFFVKIGA